MALVNNPLPLPPSPPSPLAPLSTHPPFPIPPPPPPACAACLAMADNKGPRLEGGRGSRPSGDDHLGANGRYKDIMTRRRTPLSPGGEAWRAVASSRPLVSGQPSTRGHGRRARGRRETRCSVNVDRPSACSNCNILSPTGFVNTVAYQRG